MCFLQVHLYQKVIFPLTKRYFWIFRIDLKTPKAFKTY